MKMDAVDWHSRIASSFDAGYLRSPLFMERLAVWTRLIRSHLPEGGSVLDAGCGSGVFSFVAAEAGARVVAFDGSAEMIAIAREKAASMSPPVPEFEIARLNDVARFGSECFDLVLSSSVLEYVEDIDSALRSFRASLRIGGLLLVSVPNGGGLYRRFEALLFAITGRPRYRAFVRHVESASTFAERLRQAGFQVVSEETFGSAPVVGRGLRAVGLRRAGDTLVVFAAQKR